MKLETIRTECVIPLVMGLFVGCSNASFKSSNNKPNNHFEEALGSGAGDASGLDSQPSPSGAGDDQSIGTEEKNSSSTGVGSNGSNALESEELASGLFQDRFLYGPSSKQDNVDYLFVIDNSCSMQPMLQLVREGFAQVMQTQGVFPPGAKVAVMTTMPANINDLNKVHPGVSSYSGIEKEPGFISLVNKAAINAFNGSEGPSKIFNEEGCESWFSPDAKNSSGTLCIEAHTQIKGHCVGLEAGITSFHQLLQKNNGTSLFRKGAVLNVIFVSDTHDPGAPSGYLRYTELTSGRPQPNTLKKEVSNNSTLTGFYMHAIAPNQIGQSCGDPFPPQELTYYDYSDATLGETTNCPADLTTPPNYSEFFKKMAETSKVANHPVFILKAPSSEIVSVSVDGVETKNYTLEDDQQTIVIEGLDFTTDHEISVTYK